MAEIFDKTGLTCAYAIGNASGMRLSAGALHQQFPLASVSKLFTAYAALIAVERHLLDLDQPAGPEGATIRHLFSHCAGYSFDSSTLIAKPGKRRSYTNYGIEELARELANATGYEALEWIEDMVIAPLGLTEVDLVGSPAHGFKASTHDLFIFAQELLQPSLISKALWQEFRSPQFPGLAGVLPGYGRQEPNDFGLGCDIKSTKNPHWTGSLNSAETFGHFGQAGSFLWVDPEQDLAAVFLGDKPFSTVHSDLWPELNDYLIRQVKD